MSVELVMIAPALGLILLLLVAVARIALAGNAAEAAAVSAAREASLARSTSQAQTNAVHAAQTAMAQSGYDCTRLTVTVDDRGLDVPLGQVGTVKTTVSCVINLTDIALPGLPGTKTLKASASSPIDAFRERP